jgi:hypothetical protein
MPWKLFAVLWVMSKYTSPVFGLYLMKPRNGQLWRHLPAASYASL